MRKESRKDRILFGKLRIERQLKAIYPATRDYGFGVLYARLHRLEAEAHTFAEKCCNEDVSEAQCERKRASILKRLRAILGEGPSVFINGDPRGYALKIESEVARNLDIERDWGGYGIICPEV